MSDWIEWDGSNGGHPEQLDTQVIVRFRNGKESTEPQTTLWWGGDLEHSNWNWNPELKASAYAEIVAYRVVKNG